MSYTKLDKAHDKITIWLDTLVLHVVALWLAFITLPSLNKAVLMPDGSTLYPSAGTPGSAYMTKDGQHYVRTGWGIRKVGKVVGEMLIARSKKIRRRAIARRVVFAVTALVIVACVFTLFSL